MTASSDEQRKSAEHRAAVQPLQAEQHREPAETESTERGLVLVHTGNGKGKSSSAFGVAARALGWGHRVGIVQFVRGAWKTGEREFFARFADQVAWQTVGEDFTWDTQGRERDIAAAETAFAIATEMLKSGDFELVVLDEINIALRYDYLSVQAVIEALAARAALTSVILTGRDAKPELMEMADLVSEVREIKHPSGAGVKAKRGIDF